MTNANAIQEFVRRCDELIAETESAIETENDQGFIKNYSIALKNVKCWREQAASGTLRPSLGSNFGVSKADLSFGKIEEKLYELERFYVHNL